MVHKNRWVLGTFATLAAISMLAILFSVTAYAIRGTGLVCTNTNAPNDTTYFPYRFICGSDQHAQPHAVKLQANVAGSTDPSNPTDISSGTNLSFTGGYDIPPGSGGTGIPKYKNSSGSIITPTGSDREILVWATIDGNNSLIGNTITTAQSGTPYIAITSSNGGTAGRVAQCPGDNSGPLISPGVYSRGMYSVVYNHRDLQSNGSAGFNQSPAAWNGTEGKEDCGHEGKMVYWPDAGPGQGYSFNVNLASGVSGDVCVRLNVSVRFTSGEPYFHPDNATYNNSANDQNSLGSHVIQQSEPQCYRTNNLPPPVVNSSCDYYQRSPLQGNNTYTVYRFSYFSMDQPYVTGTPSSPRVITGALSAFPWQTFSQAPIAQQIIRSTVAVTSSVPPGYVSYTVGPGGTPGTFTFRYPNPSGPDRLLYVESWRNVGSNTYAYTGGEGSKSSSRTTVGGPCYAASCRINIDPAVVANPSTVKAGDQIPASVTIRNGGYDLLRTPVSGASLGVVLGGTIFGPGGSFAAAPFKLNSTISGSPPYEATVPISITAPSTPGNFTISGYPAYYNTATSAVSFSLYGFRGGGGSQYGLPCTTNLATIPIKVPFKIIPHATLTKPGSDEDPGTLTYHTYFENLPNPGLAASAPSESVFQVNNGNIVPANNTSGPFSPGTPASNDTLNGTHNITTLTAGDQYCARATLTSYNTGAISAGGTVVDQQLIDDPSQNLYKSREQCFTVHNRPYFRVYNGSVEAGGDFSETNPACTSGGTLGGWNVGGPSTGSAGTGARFSTVALGDIIGVSSAQNTIAGTTPIRLSFANTGAGVNTAYAGVANSPPYGGKYGGANCLKDFTSPTVANPNTVHNFGNTPVGGQVVPKGVDRSIFVDGDVYISGNIELDDSGWTLAGATKIPSFVLKATGNIYVAPGVTRLDGIYEAGNTFYTCGVQNTPTSFSPMAKDSTYANCRNQLTLVGTIIAKKINLLRSYGSLRNASSGAANSGTCSNAGSRVPNSQALNDSTVNSLNNLTCGSEVFRFSPEIYIGDLNVKPDNNGAPIFDSVTSLPPVL